MKKIDINATSSRALLLFDSAARTGSFSRAAEEMAVGQPAVSHSVRQLEADLGVRLFRRLHRGVELTPTGERLAQRVRAGLREIEEGLAEIRPSSSDDQQVTLLVSTSLASHWLLPRLGHFKQQYPGIELRCITMDTDRDIPIAEFDLCIALGSGDWPGMQRWFFTDEELYPVCSPEYLRSHRSLVDNGSLLDCDLLHLEERYHSRFDWSQWFAHFDIDSGPMPSDWIYNDYSIVIHAALEGQGIAIGWRHIVQPLVDRGALVRPIAESIETDNPFYIMAPIDRPIGESAQTLRDWLIGEMNKH